MQRFLIFIIFFISFQIVSSQEQKTAFHSLDVFSLEWASNPQISPDASQIIYRRNGFDIMKDNSKGNLWILNTDGSSNRKLTSREVNESQAKWSPNGDRIAFVSSTDEGSELYMYWVKTGQIAKLSQLEMSPGNITWSPDGKQIAFTMFKAEKPPVVVKMPAKPKGANWAKPARITNRLKHEADGRGYMNPGFTHIYTIPAQGGTPYSFTPGQSRPSKADGTPYTDVEIYNLYDAYAKSQGKSMDEIFPQYKRDIRKDGETGAGTERFGPEHSQVFKDAQAWEQSQSGTGTNANTGNGNGNSTGNGNEPYDRSNYGGQSDGGAEKAPRGAKRRASRR